MPLSHSGGVFVIPDFILFKELTKSFYFRPHLVLGSPKKYSNMLFFLLLFKRLLFSISLFVCRDLVVRAAGILRHHQAC